MASQRFEGRNVDEAVEKAAETFGVPRYQVGYTVLSEKRGFLGGVKRLVIEAEIRDEIPEPTPAQIESALAAREARPINPPAPGRAARGGRRNEGRGGRRDRGRGRGGNELRTPRTARHDDGDDAPPLPAQGPESAEMQKVRAFFEELIDLSRLDLDFRTSEGDDQIGVLFAGRDRRRLLDRNGELLDSLQVISNKALVHRSVEKPIELDCHGFKEQRTNEIEEKARDAAALVERDGREFLFPAMSPIERRIVHVALRDHATVTTESRGEGFFKRVAVIRRSESV
jgi:spoIIIJ-associated protein